MTDREGVGMQQKEFIKKVRSAVANYMRSEGCSCCRDSDAHFVHENILGKLLNVPRYKDESGRNFKKFETRDEWRNQND